MNKKKFMEFVDFICRENLGSLLRDVAEVGFDTIVKEGVLRDIPVVGSFYNLCKIPGAIKQQQITNKIKEFLEDISNVSYEERRKFVEWINQNPKHKAVVGETLLLLIDREDSVKKPLITARLLEHCSLGNISYEKLRRLVFIVDRRVYMSDLNYLTSFTSGIQSNPDIAASLQSAGLLNLEGMDGGNLDEPSSAGLIYELNDYGKMLLQYGLDSAV
jgi:hypothetical protein